MIIVAGALHLDPADRDGYLAAVADVAVRARRVSGCLDFVQVADPIDPGRIHVFERWESNEALHRFRTSGGPEPRTPPLRSADVHRYRIAAVEPP